MTNNLRHIVIDGSDDEETAKEISPTDFFSSTKAKTPKPRKLLSINDESDDDSNEEESYLPRPRKKKSSPLPQRTAFGKSPEPKRRFVFGHGNPNEQAAPPHWGMKPLPTGDADCLKGKLFVISGVLDSLKWNEAEDLIKKYGGATRTAVSGKTSYLLRGQDAGATKTKKAAAVGCPIIDEDELFELIRSSKGDAPSDEPVVATASPAKSPPSAKVVVNSPQSISTGKNDPVSTKS